MNKMKCITCQSDIKLIGKSEDESYYQCKNCGKRIVGKKISDEEYYNLKNWDK